MFAGDKDPLYGSVKPTLTRLPCGEEAKVSEGCGTYICESHAEEVSVLLLNFFSENKCKNR